MNRNPLGTHNVKAGGEIDDVTITGGEGLQSYHKQMDKGKGKRCLSDYDAGQGNVVSKRVRYIETGSTFSYKDFTQPAQNRL
jgi:hypothetical protein